MFIVHVHVQVHVQVHVRVRVDGSQNIQDKRHIGRRRVPICSLLSTYDGIGDT